MIFPKSSRKNSVVANKMCDSMVDRIYKGWDKGKKKEALSFKDMFEAAQAKTEVLAVDKEAREEGYQGIKDMYSSTTSFLLWSFELYANELISIKKRNEVIEAKGQQEDKKLREIIEASRNLEMENKLLKEQVVSLQNNVVRG